MHENQVLAARVLSGSKRRLRAKFALCALSIMAASTAYATNEQPAPGEQITTSIESAPSESPQVANVAAVLWPQSRVARREGALIGQAGVSAAKQKGRSP